MEQREDSAEETIVPDSGISETEQTAEDHAQAAKWYYDRAKLSATKHS